MAKFLPYKFKTEAEAASDILPIREGQIIYVEDTQTAYLDFSGDERVAIRNITILITVADMDKVTQKGLYYVVQNLSLYYYTGSEWKTNNYKNADTAIKDALNQNISETYIKDIRLVEDEDILVFTFGDGVTQEIDLSILVLERDATQNRHGLMSAADKIKLDNLENTVVDIALSSSSENPVQNKVLYKRIINLENEILGLVDIVDTINGEVI